MNPRSGFPLLPTLASLAALSAEPDPNPLWQQAETNSQSSRQAIAFCRRYAWGWLAYADPASGLLPRTITGAQFWNAQDCAADNFPFLVLTAHVLDDYYLKQAGATLLQTERRLTTRVDGLPDTFDFATQKFLEADLKWDAILFGAAEYVKDGLTPITEALGPTPWEDRMFELLDGIWKHAAFATPAGTVPTSNLEVHGDLLQSLSRVYWRTRDPRYKTWCFRLSDLYLLHHSLLDHPQIRLRDHGCEVLSGLTEAYVIAAREDPDRRQRYRAPLHAVLDDILQHAVNPDGMMPNTYRPRRPGGMDPGISDGWGYVYNAFLTVADIDDVPRFRNAVRHALQNVHQYLDAPWEGRPADGYADSVEGALNLLNRIPVPSAFEWADQTMQRLWALQRPDGIIEGWYGDGNSARTSLMVALWKTQGIAPAPWRDDLHLGAVRGEDDTVYLYLHSDAAWDGTLRFDRPRHRDWLRLPLDYARINQFPEWFTVDDNSTYTLTRDGGQPEQPLGSALRAYRLQLKPGQTTRISVRRSPSR